LSSYYRFLIRMNLALANPCDALERPRTMLSPARGISADQIRTLLAVVPDTGVSWTATHQRRFSGSLLLGEYVAVREVIMLRVTDGRLRRHGR